MMNRKIFLPILMGVALHTQAQHARIVVQHAGNVQLFTDLTEAITAANPNADIYLSGGSFLVPGGFALDKTLHFIGAGIDPDSTNATGATILTTSGSASFALTSGAAGSSFTGIWFNPAGSYSMSLGTGAGDQVVTSVEFLRCMFQKEVRLGVEEPSNSSSSFTECIFHGTLRGSGGASVVSRCIFDYNPGTGGMIVTFRPSGLTLLNSIVLNGKTDGCENATISNCVFTRPASPPIWQSNNSTVTNCLFTYGEVFSNTSGGVEYDNIFSQDAAAIFVSELDGKHQFNDDLHLAGGSPGAGAGNDGSDIGIYGSDSPCKEGFVPHVPHYRQVDIAPGTDNNGNLRVQVKVAAQAN